MDDDLGIGSGGKAMALALKDFPEFEIIKNFAVKNDADSLVFVKDRLPAAFEIDNAQARVGEPYVSIAVKSEPVGTAMTHHFDHLLKGLPRNLPRTLKVTYPCYAAHNELGATS